jgi:membrane-associated phospholipid phosphatase
MFKIFKGIPWYGYVASVVLFGLQYGLYRLGNLISSYLSINPLLVKIDVIDNAIKVIPVFAIPYILSYALWILGPIAASMCDKKHFINFLIGILSAYFIGFLIFAFVPTYMDRVSENLYSTLGNDIFSNMLRTIYNNDGGNMAYNLFPSYHCLISLYDYFAVRKRKEIHIGYRIFSLVFALLISASTVFTKQHYVADIVGGFGISIICYIVVSKINVGERIISRYQHNLDLKKQ